MTRPAVLFSSGLDSGVLLVHAARAHGGAVPVYVQTGLAWEPGERSAAERFLASLPPALGVVPMAVLTVDMRDVYPPTHWAVRGAAPGFDTPDEDVYLEGRNIVLLSKAGVFAARAGCSKLVIGSLAHNPFPDATPTFLDAMARALSLGLDAPLEIEAPFLTMGKAEVIRIGASLGVPFELTLSCMQPMAGLHCGECSKCRERLHAFRDAGVEDPAAYAAGSQS